MLMNTQLESLLELGEVLLENNGTGQHILFLSVIGEIEGHHLSSDRIKTTKDRKSTRLNSSHQ